MLVAVIALVMALGLIGTVIPGVPGLVIIFGAAVAYGVVDGFGALGVGALVGAGVLMVLGIAAGYVLPHRAGVLAGVPKTSLRLGIAGAIVGFFVIPVLGLPIGGAAGVLLGEQRRLGDWGAAWATTQKVLVGFGIGALAEVVAGVLMIATWVVWVLLG
jgi:uncharacterized protein